MLMKLSKAHPETVEWAVCLETETMKRDVLSELYDRDVLTVCLSQDFLGTCSSNKKNRTRCVVSEVDVSKTCIKI